MAIITGFAFYNITCGQEKEVTADANEHKTAQCIGRSVAAIAILGGLITLYVLAIIGILSIGPMSHVALSTKIAICATFGGIEALTTLGLVLKALGCNK